MEYPVGVRFCPTVDEIFGHYLRLKNLGGDTSRVDEVISTVDIYSFEPFELPRHSRMESSDQVYYFFVRRQNKYKRGEKQRRQTTFGYWKITGHPTEIMRKGGDSEKIGEKRVLMFYESEPKSKSDWVMHEYIATLMPPTHQMTTYTVCKLMFKGDPKDLPTSSSAAASVGSGEIEQNHSLITHMNNPGRGLSSEGSTFELQNQRQFTGFLHLEEETQIDDAIRRVINNLSPHDFNCLLNNDNADEEEEQETIMLTQEDRNDHKPKKSLTGIFTGHSDDDSDSDLISATTTVSIQTSSTCDSFGSSYPRIDQTTDMQESPCSTIESASVTQEVRKALGTNDIDTSEKKMNPYDDDAQGSEFCQEIVIKNKRAGFIYRMVQRFTKKIKLCSCVSIA
ncbi:PREDICTED: NAC domain-containing protein 5-like [Brassica oleracea var. oleracea]|uniref:NAC domain-containing protein n=1 Tax=Brassica oleracea var. oleracea TaxID=109376 RepID=A0A0D3C727_BRAOL|nr:PREDICTED: NAC domain-containing protein 5-like [Brassica oleracea var. oleracea]